MMFVVLAVELHVMLMVFVWGTSSSSSLNFVFNRPDRSCWVRLVTERPGSICVGWNGIDGKVVVLVMVKRTNVSVIVIG